MRDHSYTPHPESHAHPHPQPHARPTGWFEAEAAAEELLAAGGLTRWGPYQDRASREVLALTILLGDENRPLTGTIGPLPSRLRYRVRDDTAWRAWTADRLAVGRRRDDASDSYAGRAWHWLNRERTILLDAPGDAFRPDAWSPLSSSQLACAWRVGLQHVRMALDALLLGQAGAAGVIGSVVVVGSGPAPVPAGEPALVLEAAWTTTELLGGTCPRPDAYRVALQDGSTVRIGQEQLISLGDLTAS
ncbi:hypothetical protein AB0C77_23555 [Streptomyces sp. NPDC048629]|uniref:hypothetical protein n=1 Tax=Streptomyces sp. NPDC048629 TaxID=3154824 RepID=UPI003448F12C